MKVKYLNMLEPQTITIEGQEVYVENLDTPVFFK